MTLWPPPAVVWIVLCILVVVPLGYYGLRWLGKVIGRLRPW